MQAWKGSRWALGVSLGLAVACGTTRRPTETIATASLAVQQAEASFAAQHAPLELVMAREKLQKAQSALDREEFDEARRLAEQAAVDAQLAQEKARTEQARKMAEDVRQSIETLQAETGRRLSRP